jgi:hypothetical protein
VRIKLSNGSVVELGENALNGLETAGTGKTSAVETSFLSEFRKKLKNQSTIHVEERMRAYCLDKVQRRIAGTYDSYFEPLGGVGVTARLFSRGLEPNQVSLNELDSACLDVLSANFPQATLYQEDMFKFPWGRKHDTIFCDFNNYTLLKFLGVYNDVTKQLFDNAKRYVVINDCSVFYLNRGARSFARYSEILGETVTNYDEFFPALQRFYLKEFPEWTLVSVDRFYASSYLLFEKSIVVSPVEVVFHETAAEKLNPVLSFEV